VEPTPTEVRLTPAEDRRRLGGIETRLISSPGGGVPLLLLHGFADSADTWRPVMDKLAAAGRAAAALDLGGFGVAEDPDPDGPLLPQWDAMVAEAIELLAERSDDGEVHIAGNSLGGCLAMRAAERDDLPVGGIVPIAPAGLHMARWLALIEGERLIRLLRFSPVPLPEIVVREVIGRVYASLAFANPRSADPALIASFTRHLPTIERGTAVLGLGRRLMPELEQPFRLDRIDCPLLLVWGDRDRMVFTTGAERVLRTVPYADIEVIERCGHCPQVEVPERLAELLLGFPHAGEDP
jgi:pimeloyl-ACP methyl ester carboxylesterase